MESLWRRATAIHLRHTETIFIIDGSLGAIQTVTLFCLIDNMHIIRVNERPEGNAQQVILIIAKYFFTAADT